MSETTTQTTESGRVRSAAERDYGKTLYAIQYEMGWRHWEGLSADERQHYHDDAAALIEAYLADHPPTEADTGNDSLTDDLAAEALFYVLREHFGPGDMDGALRNEPTIEPGVSDGLRAATKAVRDCYLADAPHQRAAEQRVIAAIRVYRAVEQRKVFDGSHDMKDTITRWMAARNELDAALAELDTLAAPTDPRPVDPSPGSGQAPDAAREE